MDTYLFFGGFAALVVTILVCSYISEKRRTDKFRLVAEELGLPFFPKGDQSLIDRLSDFHLFSEGHGKKIENTLHGDSGTVEVAIFGYKYTVGSGKNSSTKRQSVVYFRSASLDLPQFAVRPESFFHKIGGVFGYQDIDFESHAGFSKSYLLRGTDEEQVRETFNDEVLDFFEQNQGVSVEAARNDLIFYRASKRIKPTDVRQFMEEGFRVFRLFESAFSPDPGKQIPLTAEGNEP